MNPIHSPSSKGKIWYSSPSFEEHRVLFFKCLSSLSRFQNLKMPNLKNLKFLKDSRHPNQHTIQGEIKKFLHLNHCRKTIQNGFSNRLPWSYRRKAFHLPKLTERVINPNSVEDWKTLLTCRKVQRVVFEISLFSTKANHIVDQFKYRFARWFGINNVLKYIQIRGPLRALSEELYNAMLNACKMSTNFQGLWLHLTEGIDKKLAILSEDPARDLVQKIVFDDISLIERLFKKDPSFKNLEVLQILDYLPANSNLGHIVSFQQLKSLSLKYNLRYDTIEEWMQQFRVPRSLETLYLDIQGIEEEAKEDPKNSALAQFFNQWESLTNLKEFALSIYSRNQLKYKWIPKVFQKLKALHKINVSITSVSQHRQGNQSIFKLDEILSSISQSISKPKALEFSAKELSLPSNLDENAFPELKELTLFSEWLNLDDLKKILSAMSQQKGTRLNWHGAFLRGKTQAQKLKEFLCWLPSHIDFSISITITNMWERDIIHLVEDLVDGVSLHNDLNIIFMLRRLSINVIGLFKIKQALVRKPKFDFSIINEDTTGLHFSRRYCVSNATLS